MSSALDKIFTLDKNIWTEADFEFMGWHDATIYGLLSRPETG